MHEVILSMNPAVLYLLTFVVGYLFGSIMFALIFSKAVKGIDVRTVGNKNPGAGNTYRNVGPVWGILTGILDACKSLVPLLIGKYVFHLPTLALGFMAFGAVIGHGFPIYFGFRGGRSAATMLGVLVFFVPIPFLVGFIVGPVIVLSFIKTNRSYWFPFWIITITTITTLVTHHSLQVKLIVIVCAILALFLNRTYLPKMVKNIVHKTEEQ
ncbi:MAG: glycerol-3-phosphate acyltransferase [Candidatus Marinimicrobia bacterium]|nr:glycerol-3-phosphate acyltransferase [Candidatus Neomarinimicrobiota bacterium]